MLFAQNRPVEHGYLHLCNRAIQQLPDGHQLQAKSCLGWSKPTSQLQLLNRIFSSSDSTVETRNRHFLAQNVPYFNSIVGKNKTDPQVTAVFEKYLKNYVNSTIKPDLPSDYLHFGNNVNYQNVPYISFFMASLRPGPNMTFEIDPFGKRGVTYFSQLTACLRSSVPRVSAVFDLKTNIISLQVYDSTGRLLRGFSDEKAATLLLYQCSYYAQNIHASPHVSNERKMQNSSIFASNQYLIDNLFICCLFPYVRYII